MTVVRRLDHVAIAVRDTDQALQIFRDRFGLRVAHSEELDKPPVRLTYLECGNAYVQLLEPLDGGQLEQWIEEHGEGLHHICFATDDALTGAETLAPPGAPAPLPGSGRGRQSAFVPGEPPHGVRIECTEFRRTEDVDASPGWLP